MFLESLFEIPYFVQLGSCLVMMMRMFCQWQTENLYRKRPTSTVNSRWHHMINVSLARLRLYLIVRHLNESILAKTSWSLFCSARLLLIIDSDRSHLYHRLRQPLKAILWQIIACDEMIKWSIYDLVRVLQLYVLMCPFCEGLQSSVKWEWLAEILRHSAILGCAAEHFESESWNSAGMFLHNSVDIFY